MKEDYEHTTYPNNHFCSQEARLSAIEIKLQNKKENLHEVHEDYYHLRDKLELISENVIKLTTILENNTEKEEQNDSRIEDLRVEIAKVNMKVEKTNSSIGTLQYIIGIGIPIICIIISYIMDKVL